MIPVAKPYLTKEEAQNAYDTVLSNWVTQGPRVQEFEEKFAEYVGSKYAVALSNCTTALHLSLVVAGIQPGDEVICPSYSFIATANSIVHAGAVPVFADVLFSTGNLDPDSAEKKITEKTKAILLVHQIGVPADIDAFRVLCEKHKLKLIEDAACAAGSEYKGKKIGSHSELVCFSFHPRKVITTGDGGMVTTSNEEYYNRLKLLRQHGMSVNDRLRHNSKTVILEEYLEVGYNFRMTDVQASIGIRQLEKLDYLVNERRKIAEKYNEELKNIKHIILPTEPENCRINYQTYSVYLKKDCKVSRNDLMQQLLDRGISSRRGVMSSHLESPFRSGNSSLPVSEDLSDRSIVIPLYVPMTAEETSIVIDTLKELLA